MVNYQMGPVSFSACRGQVAMRITWLVELASRLINWVVINKYYSLGATPGT